LWLNSRIAEKNYKYDKTQALANKDSDNNNCTNKVITS